MEIKQIKTSELKSAEYNPREMTETQNKDLKDSIKKFGMVDPIIVNKHEGRENIVIGGHQRLRICEDMLMAEVPVFYLDLDIEKEKELNIRLNKNTGQWDFDKLANDFDIDELLDFGFKEYELGFFGNKMSNKQKKDKVNEMYNGMPEFEQDELVHRTLFIHFRNDEDVERFAKLISQRVTPKNKSYWFPEEVKDVRDSEKYEEK